MQEIFRFLVSFRDLGEFFGFGDFRGCTNFGCRDFLEDVLGFLKCTIFLRLIHSLRIVT